MPYILLRSLIQAEIEFQQEKQQRNLQLRHSEEAACPLEFRIELSVWLGKLDLPGHAHEPYPNWIISVESPVY
jgi:hypothetical protein